MEPQAVAAVAALEDDVRSRLYAFVRAADCPVSRAAAADAVGISAKLAAFHLDKLVSAGLLRAHTFAVGVRRVGRAPKVYEPTDQAITVSIPPRQPQLLAEILTEAVLAERTGERAQSAVLRVARERGVRVGQAERERRRPGRLGAERAMSLSCALLAQHGFEPKQVDGAVRLRNCPFHPLAATATELVCGLNHAFIGGVIDGLQAETSVQAVLAPADGQCCVELRRAS